MSEMKDIPPLNLYVTPMFCGDPIDGHFEEGVLYRCAFIARGSFFPRPGEPTPVLYSLKVPTERVCRAEFRPFAPGLQVSPPADCYVIGIRIKNCPDSVLLHRIGSLDEPPFTGGSFDAAAYNVDDVQWCPLDAGLVSDDRPLVIEFSAISDEPQQLILVLIYALYARTEDHNPNSHTPWAK